MNGRGSVEHELEVAAAALREGNDGKARVCARRAVARAVDAWQVRCQAGAWRGDAMVHLRRIQQESLIPIVVRQAAERLSTTVMRRDAAPFTNDPISDAKVIIAFFNNAEFLP